MKNKSLLYPTHINNTQIYYPKKHHTYRIKSNEQENNEEIIIHFKEDFPEIIYLDIATFCYQTENMAKRKELEFERDPTTKTCPIYIYKDSLPISIRQTNFPPILYYSKHEPDFLQSIWRLDLTKGYSSFKASNLMLKPVQGITIYNPKIQQECQVLAGDIPVVIGDYPVFYEPHRPDYEFLETLYNKFLRYNDEDKLKEQYEKSRNHCFCRAQFSSILLNHYGISTVKVFKQWNSYHWKKFLPPNAREAWIYHCATMVVDSKNQKWIWDPWVGLNQQLLTLDQWLNRENEPKPIRLSITNHVILADFSNGKYPGCEFLMYESEHNYFKSYQAIFTLAIPNPPERPLAEKKVTENYAVIKQSFFKLSSAKREGLDNLQPGASYCTRS